MAFIARVRPSIVLRAASSVFARGARAAARPFSSRSDDAMSGADITSYFLDVDAKATAAEVSSLPIKVSGRTGEHVAALYAAGVKGKNFPALVSQLEAVLAAVHGGGLVVERFFSTSNYSPEECVKVIDLLTSSKEPLATFAGIKDAEIRELLVDNEDNLDAWRGARKSISGVNLSEPARALLESLAKEGRLDRLKRVIGLANELAAVTAKTVGAVIASAVPLTKAQQEAITKALPTYVSPGQSLTTSFVVDSSIIGGLSLTLGKSSIDLTVSSRLAEVAQQA